MALTCLHDEVHAPGPTRIGRSPSPRIRLAPKNSTMYSPSGTSSPYITSGVASSATSTDDGTASLFMPANPEQQAAYTTESTIPQDPESLTYLFNHALRFFEPAFSTTDGVMAQVPPMYRTSPEGSSIRSAMNALAMERLGLDTGDSDLLSQAQSEYGRTLMKVREALGDAFWSRQDETLVTIQLLCHFEFIRSVVENVPFTHTHGDAIPLLLKHRGSDQLQHERSQTMFLCFQNRLLLYCIDGWYAFEDMLGELSEIPEYPDNTGLRLMRVAREVNRIQTRITSIKRANISDQSQLLAAVQSILNFGREVDGRLESWSFAIEDMWRYRLIPADEVILEENRFADQVHVYPNIWIARIWNGWRTIRINLHSALNDMLNWSQATLGADFPEERRHIGQIVQAMVDEVCNSTHYHLGNRTSIDPEPVARFPTRGPDDVYERHSYSWGWFHLLVPLRTCHKAPALTSRQRQWIYRSLVRISRLARQTSNMPPPTSPPVLMTGHLPSNAFAFPMFISAPEDEGPQFAPVSAEMDFFQFEHPAASTTPFLPSQPASGYFDPAGQSSYASMSPGQPQGEPSSAMSSPTQVDLPFFNTTRPDQIKDPETQKKIRRDVMLHHMRNQDPKQREERQRKARAGSAARAASRRERAITGQEGASGSEGTSSSAAQEKPGSKKSSGRGKERKR